MANDYFQFKQFTVHQNCCAMKVGTDGTLLGAWAQVHTSAARILDIGTGTGLIALMMAQRFPEASVLGIDIDQNAVIQAQENITASPFASRIMIKNENVLDFDDTEGFDAIVSNPPYFVDALTCPDHQRTMARHTVSLTYEGLMKSAFRLLNHDGVFSLVIPSENRSLLEAEAHMTGFFLSRVCLIRTTPKKQPKRQLIELLKHPVDELYIEDGIIEELPNVRSAWYQQLTHDFYIR
jgi:tRNA1Val (adenine37-N6)-methyltransferase